jgi:hypothetical protein
VGLRFWLQIIGFIWLLDSVVAWENPTDWLSWLGFSVVLEALNF